MAHKKRRNNTNVAPSASSMQANTHEYRTVSNINANRQKNASATIVTLFVLSIFAGVSALTMVSGFHLVLFIPPVFVLTASVLGICRYFNKSKFGMPAVVIECITAGIGLASSAMITMFFWTTAAAAVPLILCSGVFVFVAALLDLRQINRI